MKILSILIALFLTISTNANELHKVEVPDTMYLQGTYSSETSNDGSFHLMILQDKSTKDYVIKPIFISNDEQLLIFNEVPVSYLPEIISHHSSNNISSFVTYNDKEKTVAVHNFNTIDKTYTTSFIDEVKTLGLLFRLDNKTLLFDYSKKEKTLNYTEISTNNKIAKRTINIPAEYQKKFEKLHVTPPINQNEFVEKGPLNSLKAHIIENKLVITEDLEDSKQTTVLSMSLDNKDRFSFKKLQVGKTNIEKIKDYNSYLFENNLYTIVVGKKEFEIKIFDAEKELLINSLSLRNDISKGFEDIKRLADYLDVVSKGRIRPTITANKTIEDHIKITIDQADKNLYYYNYDWSWHHQMMHQQMMEQVQQRLPTGFGPNPIEYDNHQGVYFKKEDPKPIIIIINKQGEILQDAKNETVLKNIDKEKNLKIFEEDKDYKNISASFSSTTMNYIYQDRKSKNVFIKSKTIVK